MIKKVINIPDGDAGIDTTVKHMWRLINRDVNSSEVISKATQLKGKTDFETIKNTFNYVYKNHPYKSDPIGKEQLTAPKNMLNGENPREDCDGLVMLLICLLLANKIQARIKTIAWRRYEFTHVIAEVKYNGMWLPMDPTKKGAGFGDQVRKVIREKIFENPMELITLEDNVGGCSTCRKGSRRRHEAENVNIINIGNEESVNADLFKNFRIDTPTRDNMTRIIERPVERKIKVPVEVPVVKEKIVPVQMPVWAFQPKAAKYYKEFY